MSSSYNNNNKNNYNSKLRVVGKTIEMYARKHIECKCGLMMVGMCKCALFGDGTSALEWVGKLSGESVPNDVSCGWIVGGQLLSAKSGARLIFV